MTTEYYRSAIITSEHPGKPLEGIVVALSTSYDFSVPDTIHKHVIETANEKFDVESYAADLLLGTLYYDTDTESVIGVKWQDNPVPYSHGDFNEPVESLPNTLTELSDAA